MNFQNENWHCTCSIILEIMMGQHDSVVVSKQTKNQATWSHGAVGSRAIEYESMNTMYPTV